MRLPSNTFVINAGLVALGLCVGAAGINAWQARPGKAEGRSAVSSGSMSTFIRNHNSAHVDNLPIQRIDDLY
jgi:hypothetical protein